ncbi:DUF975 family protein [Mediterraneibacter sp. NSJ-55]|uniref:DUF975 family protein n=1 Tax=Mediterraneibacter hominis TaxID=2763054 RepID=A0A923LM62_9FIRM|nr:DUF975 family protein [Mediterraneibacter hominis]MBC5690444.1 DUF975 family protein [Mediterraneibacter hominis]
MWHAKGLKQNAKKSLQKNFWRILGICLLVGFIATGMRVTHHVDNAAKHFIGGRFEFPSNAQIMNELYQDIRQRNAPEYNETLEQLGQVYTPEKGVLARIYNRMTEDKSVLYGFVNAMDDIFLKDKATQGIIILAGVVILLLFLAFISNILLVGQCRFLLENRSYQQVKLGRLLFPWRVRRWRKTAFTMFERSFFIFLWDLTIIGGIIKRYSYKMIPYILAENPDIGHTEAFELSRKMMYGNKMKTFLLDLSFLGWRVLNLFTFGILRYVWINPYVEAVYAELYCSLRQEALAQKYPHYEYLNDTLLFTASSLEDYPVEQYPLYNPNTKKWMKTDYRRTYSIRSVILIFFSFSMIGWLWEVSLHLFGDGVFVNRGFFHGPWLPIYGTGGVLIILLLKKFVDRPLVTFFMTVLVCGIVEYFVALFLWEFKQMYWWNYTGYFLNLHGRICAEGLLIFGLGGCAFIYILAPFFDEIFKKIPKKIAIIICAVLLTVFAADTAYSMIHPNSGAGITDYETH